MASTGSSVSWLLDKSSSLRLTSAEMVSGRLDNWLCFTESDARWLRWPMLGGSVCMLFSSRESDVRALRAITSEGTEIRSDLLRLLAYQLHISYISVAYGDHLGRDRDEVRLVEAARTH